jgi:hypothetical protein
VYDDDQQPPGWHLLTVQLLAWLLSAGDHFLAKYQLDEVHDSVAEQQLQQQQQQQPELSDQASVHKAAHINNTVDCS